MSNIMATPASSNSFSFKFLLTTLFFTFLIFVFFVSANASTLCLFYLGTQFRTLWMLSIIIAKVQNFAKHFLSYTTALMLYKKYKIDSNKEYIFARMDSYQCNNTSINLISNIFIHVINNAPQH